MKDLMVDLETWGNDKDSVIVQIGACYFDRYTGEIGDTFSVNIDANESMRLGFNVWPSTIYWWLQQSDEARRSFLTDTVATTEAIIMFNDFAKKSKQIWSHATFDFILLMGHFQRLNVTPKFHYRNARDIRTLVDLAKVDTRNFERIGTHHNALDDCIFQVKYCTACFKKLNTNL